MPRPGYVAHTMTDDDKKRLEKLHKKYHKKIPMMEFFRHVLEQYDTNCRCPECGYKPVDKHHKR